MNNQTIRMLAPHIDPYKPVPIEIECVSYFQIPHFKIIGLPNTEVSEARERVRAAFQASQIEFPRRNLVVNLAPADLPKSGLGLDLAIALAIWSHRWSARHQETFPHLNHLDEAVIAAWGALALDGSVRPCGNIPRVVESLREHPPQMLLMHPEDVVEMEYLYAQFSSLPGFDALMQACFPIRHFSEISAPGKVSHWNQFDERLNTPHDSEPEAQHEEKSSLLDLPIPLLRALLASVAGQHHILLVGPRGVGKSYALKWLEQLLPPPSLTTQWQTRVRTGTLPSQSPVWIRELSPDVSTAALLGSVGHHQLRIGELALADEGIVIADEFPEWNRDSRESLRAPLDQGCWTLSRASRTVHFSSRFIFAATANHCPCGGIPRDHRRTPRSSSCVCSLSALRAYRRRLSGPILDRIDAIVDIGNQSDPLTTSSRATSRQPTLEDLQGVVRQTRRRLEQQWGSLPGQWSAETTENYSHHMQLSPELDQWLRGASLRTRHKCIRLAATLAALDGIDVPRDAQWSQAWSYRAESHGLT